MRILTLSIFATLMGAGPALADGLPVGLYDCTLQMQGSPKLLPIGVLTIAPEGFSGPVEEGKEAEQYVYLLNPDNSVHWPVEFATAIAGGKEVVDATYYDFLAVVQTNILLVDDTPMSVACGLRPE